MGTIIGEGITFDDVLLVPQYSEDTPNMIDLRTHLTKKIVLNIPMMSAAMDTVTESKMERSVKVEERILASEKRKKGSKQSSTNEKKCDMIQKGQRRLTKRGFFAHFCKKNRQNQDV